MASSLENTVQHMRSSGAHALAQQLETAAQNLASQRITQEEFLRVFGETVRVFQTGDWARHVPAAERRPGRRRRPAVSQKKQAAPPPTPPLPVVVAAAPVAFPLGPAFAQKFAHLAPDVYALLCAAAQQFVKECLDELQSIWIHRAKTAHYAEPTAQVYRKLADEEEVQHCIKLAVDKAEQERASVVTRANSVAASLFSSSFVRVPSRDSLLAAIKQQKRRRESNDERIPAMFALVCWLPRMNAKTRARAEAGLLK